MKLGRTFSLLCVYSLILYPVPVAVTLVGDSQDRWKMIQAGKRDGVCYGVGDRASRGLRRNHASEAGAQDTGREAEPAAAGAGGDLRWRSATRRGAYRRGRAADRARLGCAIQCRGSGRTNRPQAAWPAAEAQRGAAAGVGADDRGRADPGGARRRALAAGRSDGVGLGGPDRHRQADAEPGAEVDGLSQALRPATPSCARPCGSAGF